MTVKKSVSTISFVVALALMAAGTQSSLAQDVTETQETPPETAVAELPASVPPASEAAPAEDSAAQPSATTPETPEAVATVEAPKVAMLNPIEAPPAGKGQIVFFRPSRFVGAAVSFSVREGDTGIGKLTNGTYFVHVADPGVKEYNISFETRDTLRMEIEEGETYYVIQAIGMGIVAARPNLTPSTEEAFQEKKLKVSKAKATDRN